MNLLTMGWIAKLTLLALSKMQNTHSTPTFATIASCVFVPTGLLSHHVFCCSALTMCIGIVPQLPIELIHHIINLSDWKSLPALCLVNSVFQEVATAYLYDYLHLCKPTTLVRCLQTLSRSPELVGCTHSFMYDRNILSGNGLSIDNISFFATTLGMLLHVAMQNLSNVTYLTLHLLGPLGKSLHGAPFRLVSLVTTAD